MRLPYPTALGVWPAFALLLAFAWVELIYPNPAVPLLIAWLAVAYSILTFSGMFVFGRECWLAHGEVFTLIFGTFARFAPLELRPGPQRALLAAAVRSRAHRHQSGFDLDDGVRAAAARRPFCSTARSARPNGAGSKARWPRSSLVLGDLKLMAVRTAGLLAFWLVFFGAYLGVSALMSAAAVGRLAPLAMARQFAFTLVPIAIGYHLAHYLTFLLIQGQYIIPLASDPFGFGWNLFGTAGYRVDIAIVDARFAWYTAVTAILMGHIAAVYLAHRKAIEVLDARGAALRSQVPLTALMVVYTFVSLSILAEPMVERRAPAQPSQAGVEIGVPADAVLPEPGSGRLRPVGEGRIAKQKLTYRAMGSAFHDGTRTSATDLVYAYMFAYRWGTGAEGGDARRDPAVEAATAVMRAHLLGVRVAGTDNTSKSFRIGDFEVVRELFVVEVYTSTPPIDAEQDAVVAPPWSTLPWHVLVLMEEAVQRGWAAFSRAEAQRRGVEWLDLVRSDDMNQRLAALVAAFERDGYRPEHLASLVGVEDARKRWAALAAFYKEHGHFLVTNGPYRLKRWSSDSVMLEAFRDLTYPLGVGSFDAYAVPRRGFITQVERDNQRIRLSGDIELVRKYQRSYDIVRQPLQSIAADVLKRAAPECRYTVLDGDGRVILAGQVALADAGFVIDLSGKLAPGQFTLLAEIIVNGNAMNAEIKQIPLVISSNP